jgi:hypothetical protein
MTTSGIELATFWLVAQSLKQLRHRVHLTYKESLKSVVPLNAYVNVRCTEASIAALMKVFHMEFERVCKTV